MQFILILLLLLLIYAWFLYPVLLTIVSRSNLLRPVSAERSATEMNVNVLFSAYNEEKTIGCRLENLDECRKLYNKCRVTVWVGVDGSIDKTAEIANEFASIHENIHVVEFLERRGKVPVLKDLLRKSREQMNHGWTQTNAHKKEEAILVFTDANTMFRPDVLEKLLAHFSDPKVGGVCGRLEFMQTIISRSSSEGFYWRWENKLKVVESNIDSCLGANDAIYAVRNCLFPDDIPDNAIVDDFVIGMKVREQGFRMLYDPDAVAEEEFPEERHEWRRRVRIGVGDFQALTLCWRCLLPQYGAFAWQFWSHKVLRWLTPHLVLLLVICSLFLVGNSGLSVGRYLPLVILTCITGFILCSLIGRFLNSSAVHPVGRICRMCHYFLVMNMALFAGSIRFFAGDLKGYWERTPRGVENVK